MGSSQRPILLQIVSSRLWGGMERYALDISRAFDAMGWDVQVITRDARMIDTMFARAGLKVRHAPLSGYFDLTSTIALRRFLRRHSNAPLIAIHTHHYRDAFAALLARKLTRIPRSRVRVVCTHHRCRPAREGALMRRIYRNLDAFIFVSALARRRFLSRWPEGRAPFPDKAMHTLSPALDPADVPPYTPPPEKGPFTLLYLGRLSPEKGIERLIRAMRLLKGKRVRLAIAGTGYADYVDSLHRLAEREGVGNLLDWKGWSERPMELIADCHAGICVSPREEPFSYASVELMACGRTQIVPPGGAFDEYLTPTDTAAIESESAPQDADSVRLSRLTEESIAQTVLALATRRDLCEEMGRHALAACEKLPTCADAMQRLRALYLGT